MSNSQRLKYREKRYKCGKYLFVNIYPYVETIGRTNRKQRRAVSREAVRRINQKNRENEVNRIICANFTGDDYYLTLTYKDECTDRKQAFRDFENFIKRLNRLRKKRGLSAVKWIKIIEIGRRCGRIHIHCIITGGITPQEIAATWGKGYIDCKPLMFDNTGCKELARYLVKQAGGSESSAAKSADDQTAKTRSRSWTCSRSCTRPEPKTNNSKYSKRKVNEIADRARADDRRALDTLYNGYECTSAKSYYQDDFGLDYVYLIYRRKTEPSAKPRRTREYKTRSNYEKELLP